MEYTNSNNPVQTQEHNANDDNEFLQSGGTFHYICQVKTVATEWWGSSVSLSALILSCTQTLQRSFL